MATTDSSLFAVKGQAYLFKVVIRSTVTGNPITGGLTDLAGTASIDGGAFSATGVTVLEIGTTGYVTVSLDSTRMTGNSIVVQVTASNTNALYASVEIKPADLSEVTGRADAATVKRLEAYINQLWQVVHNLEEINRATGSDKRYLADSTTVSVQGVVSDDGATGTRGKLS